MINKNFRKIFKKINKRIIFLLIGIFVILYIICCSAPICLRTIVYNKDDLVEELNKKEGCKETAISCAIFDEFDWIDMVSTDDILWVGWDEYTTFTIQEQDEFIAKARQLAIDNRPDDSQGNLKLIYDIEFVGTKCGSSYINPHCVIAVIKYARCTGELPH